MRHMPYTLYHIAILPYSTYHIPYSKPNSPYGQFTIHCIKRPVGCTKPPSFGAKGGNWGAPYIIYHIHHNIPYSPYTIFTINHMHHMHHILVPYYHIPYSPYTIFTIWPFRYPLYQKACRLHEIPFLWSSRWHLIKNCIFVWLSRRTQATSTLSASMLTLLLTKTTKICRTVRTTSPCSLNKR